MGPPASCLKVAMDYNQEGRWVTGNWNAQRLG